MLIESLSKENKDGLSKVAENYNRSLDFVIIELSKLEGIFLNRFQPNKIIYAYVMAPMLLDGVTNKLLVLDADILVQCDISKLWDTDIEDFHVAAIQEPIMEDSRKIDLEMPLTVPYFNAGVLLINCQKWREDKVGKRAIRFAIDRSDIIHFHDQDALNHLLWGSCKIVHPKWNQINNIHNFSRSLHTNYNEKEFWECKNNPCIIHYTYIKPTSAYCRHPDREKYRDYLRNTIWESALYSDKSIRNRIRSAIRDFLTFITYHEKRLEFKKRRVALMKYFSKT